MDIAKIERNFSATPDGKCAEASGGMVATAFPEATHAGVEMLKQGGNAVDAACAAAFALCVCEPQASGLGGQSMALLHMNGKAIAINGSGRIPSLGHHSQFRAEDLITGYKCTTVPSTPAVLGHLSRKYGQLRWSTIISPAINIARNGYRMTQLQHDLQQQEIPNFETVNSRTGTQYFLKNGGKPYAVGDIFFQPELARVLEIIARDGPEAFYTGQIARMIDEDMRRHQGLLRADDLAYIPWPTEHSPIRIAYEGLPVLTMPPPSPGRILLLLLRIFEQLHRADISLTPLENIRFLAEALRHTLLEYGQQPVRYELYEASSDPMLHDDTTVQEFFAKILKDSRNRKNSQNFPKTVPKDRKGGETTHLSVIDTQGNAIGISQSINLIYGSKATAEGLGFLYNNYLSDSITDQPEHPHFLRPNGIPVSMVCPTIVLRHQAPWIVTGSPGSERIISTLLQFLLHVFDGELPIGEAMRKPRLHCSPQGQISLESSRFDPGVVEFLSQHGYELIHYEPYAFYHGAVHAVLRRQTGEGFQGVAEIRRDGIALGCDKSK
jgi:gamma-glutamyltranspeptidase/glutathione hydrolase